MKRFSVLLLALTAINSCTIAQAPAQKENCLYSSDVNIKIPCDRYHIVK